MTRPSLRANLWPPSSAVASPSPTPLPTVDPRTPSGLPVLVYDGDCAFCRYWVRRLRGWVGDGLECLPQQNPDCLRRFPDLDPEALAHSVHLVEPDGRVVCGAEAVVHALRTLPAGPAIVWSYCRLPGAAAIAERAYAWVARHRARISRVWQLVYGPFDENGET